MKLLKSQRSNLLFFGVLALIFFTPLRGIIQEQVARLISFSPSMEDIDDRVTLDTYSWNLEGINTSDFNFNDAKGKIVLINFWATWCPPCRAEMPSLQSLYNDYKGRVVFVFLTNEEPSKVIKYLDKEQFDIPSFNQLSNAPNEFSVSSIPVTYVIDKEGTIVVHKVGPADWNSDKFRSVLDALIGN